MGMLKGQDAISQRTPMPVDVLDESSRVTDVAGETVTLVVASTNVNSAGEAAGTVVYARLTNTGVLDSAKIRVGNAADTSFAFVTGTVLTTQVEWPWGTWDAIDDDDRATKMAAVGALLSNGQFCLDHRTGLLIGKKATTADSDTAGYSYRTSSSNIVGTVTVSGTGLATEAKQDTQITSLQLLDDAVATTGSAITAKGFAVSGTDGTNARILKTDTSGELQVDVLSSALPTGAATLAEQQTQTTSLAAIETAVEIIDNAISGSEMQVDVVTSALPTGAATEATLANMDTSVTDIEAAVELIDDTVFTDDAAFTPGTSKGLAIGMQADETAADSVDEGDFGVPRMTLDRRQRVANKSIEGPGEPTIDSFTHASFNLAAGADQVLVSSAANKQIWVYGIGFTVNVAGTVSFQDEDNTAITGIMQFGATGGMVVAPSGNFSMPIWKLGTDKDLEVDVVTSELDGWVSYAIVSV